MARFKLGFWLRVDKICWPFFIYLCLMLLCLPATQGYAAKISCQSVPEEELPGPGQKPEVAKIKELLKKGRNAEAGTRIFRAIRPYQEALKLSETTLGPEHLLTIVSMTHLARIYTAQGYFDQALPLAQQSLKLSEKVLGAEHPQTARSLVLIGSLYGEMGLHDKALSLSQRALKISQKASGPNTRRPRMPKATWRPSIPNWVTMTRPCPWPGAPPRSGKRCWDLKTA
jgi:tetratricopeptide (TPR) repeat protein